MKNILRYLFIVLLINHISNTAIMGQTVEGDSTVLAELYVNTGGPEGFWSPDWPYDRTTQQFTSDPFNWPGVTVNQNTGLVTRIELAGFGLTGNLPEDFSPPQGVSALAGLKILDLSNNTSLSGTVTSEFMRFMSTVEILNISGVRIHGTLPPNINTLTKLTNFNISSTKISSIPAEIGSMSQLVRLNLSNNLLTALPASIYQLNTLTELYLNNNLLLDLPIPAAFSNNAVKISIQNNRLDFCDLEKLKQGFPNAIILSSPQASTTALLPEPVNATIGEEITLTAAVCGENNSFQWQKRVNSQWGNIASETANSYQLVVTSNSNGAVIRCKVNNLSLGELTIYSELFRIEIVTDWAPDLAVATNEDVASTYSLLEYFSQEQQLAFFDILLMNNFIYEFEITKQPENGTLSNVSNEASFTYKPNANFFGEDEFEYQLTIGGNSNTGKVIITVNPVNDRPVLTLFSATGEVLSPFELDVTYGDTVYFKAVLDDSKDRDLTCESLELAINSTSLNGKIIYDEATQIAGYIPTQNVTASDIITLVAKEKCDNPLNSSALLAIFKIEELVINTDPVASDLSVEVNSGVDISFDVPATDLETSLNNLIVNMVTNPVNAAFFGYANGKFTYKSTGNFSGPDSFTFTITDEAGAISNAGTVTIDVKMPQSVNLPDWLSEDNIVYLTANSQGWRTINGFTTSEKNRYPNSYLEFRYDNSKFFFWDLTSLGWNNYITSVKPNVNMRLFGLYKSGLPVVKMVNNIYSMNDLHFTVNYRDRLSNRIIASRKIYVTETWGSSRLKSSEIIEHPEMFNELVFKDNDFEIYKEANQDNSFLYSKSAKIVNVGETIVSTRDTVTISFGVTQSITFSAASFEGQLTMTVTGQPTKGTVSGFSFDSYESDFFFTNYSGDYTPTSNADTWDSIVYSISNNLETITETKVIRIIPQKVAPTIANLINQSSPEDSVFTLDLGISDGDNTIDQLDIEVSITSTTSGFTYTTVNGVLEITPPLNFHGNALVEVSVMDPDLQHAYDSFTLTITPVNDAPVINFDEEYSTDYDELFHLVVSASDVDGNVVTLTATGMPAWLNYAAAGSSAGVFSGTPEATDADVYTITLKANDGIIETENKFTIIVIGPVSDNPPVVANLITPKELAKGFAPLNINIENIFTDPDSDEVTVTVLSNTNSKWISTTITNKILTISLLDDEYTGFAIITLQGKSKGLTANTSFNVYTLDNPPILTGNIDDITVWKNEQDVEIDLQGLVTDPDKDDINYEVFENNNPDLVDTKIIDEKLILSFTEGNGGNSEIYVKGGAYGKNVETAFRVTVKDAVPTINSPVSDQSMLKSDSPLSVDLSYLFIDSDDPSVTLSIKSISDETKVSAVLANDMITITPTGEEGSSTITILGTSNDNTIEYSFIVEVKDKAPYVKIPIEDQTLNKNSNPINLNLSDLFADDDDIFVTLSIASVTNTSLAIIELNDYMLPISPVQGKSGSTSITIEGTSGGKTASYTFILTIEDQSPKKITDIPSVSVLKNATPYVVNLDDYFNDPDGDEITYSITSNSNTSLVTPTLTDAELTISFVSDNIGEATLEITALADGKTVKSTFDIVVASPSGISDITMNEYFKVYPNPLDDVLTIQWEGEQDLQNVEIRITDVQGRTIILKVIDQIRSNEEISIPMDEVSKGIYLMRISANNNYEFIKKLIK